MNRARSSPFYGFQFNIHTHFAKLILGEWKSKKQLPKGCRSKGEQIKGKKGNFLRGGNFLYLDLKN